MLIGNADASTSEEQSPPKGDWEGWYSYGGGGTVHATDSRRMRSVYPSHWSSGSERKDDYVEKSDTHDRS